MSERRQLALLLAGLVALVGIGIGGATLFPERCTGLEQLGDLDLAFADAADALPLSQEDGETVHRVGEEVGIGSWRGAVALPDGARILPSEFGFFIVTEQDFTVLRPSIGIASAARGRAGLDVLPAGASLALRAADGETGVFNGEYELDRCGQLPPDDAVRTIDRGFALVEDGSELVLVTLSGDEVWRTPSVPGSHLAEDVVVLGQDTLLELRDIRTGEVVDTTTTTTDVPVPAPVPWLHATEDRLLLAADTGIVPVTFGAGGLDLGEVVPLPLAPGPVTAAVRTPGGIVALGQSNNRDEPLAAALATDRSPVAGELPPAIEAVALHTSQDGHVGVVVEVDGQQALLVYGRDVA